MIKTEAGGPIMPFQADGYQVTRHVCPRNCYDACGMLGFVKNGRLEKVTGDPLHGYTKGKLCAKGYSYIKRQYHPERLKYPIRQVGGRGSGRWERITWDEALDIISEKIIMISDQYQSTLPLCLNKYSGNFGLLHYAAEGLFNSLGPTTQAVGSPCWSAGLDAQYLDMGGNRVSAPQEMEKASLVILWGVNPAWTAIHSLPYMYRAREKGASIIVIDPLYTQTAKKADLYIQIIPGTDGALALALAAIIWRSGKADRDFLDRYTTGWEQFVLYLDSLNLDSLAAECGQSLATITLLANLIVERKPVFIWAGFGLQRHCNGGQNLRAIDALAALIGNIGKPGSGVHYAHLETWDFTYHILHKQDGRRAISINQFAENLKMMSDPPIRFVWFSCRNAVTQDARSNFLIQQLGKMDFVVTVEQFLTPTASNSDIVLPCTTHFEELDVVPSYWHHWLAINEQAVQPYCESKSELSIAQALAKKMNKSRQGSCSFETDKNANDFLDCEFSEAMYQLFDISHWTELLTGPRQAKLSHCAWEDGNFMTPSGKYEFYSEVAKVHGLIPLPTFCPTIKPSSRFPFRLMSPHSQHGLNSQFLNLDWFKRDNVQPIAYLNTVTAAQKKINAGQLIRLVNTNGTLIVKAEPTMGIPHDVVVVFQGWLPKNNNYLNSLIDGVLSDMGELRTGAKGLAFYDAFVQIEKL
jgi:anaerobic selenocysteine-containing dehydrogenase